MYMKSCIVKISDYRRHRFKKRDDFNPGGDLLSSFTSKIYVQCQGFNAIKIMTLIMMMIIMLIISGWWIHLQTVRTGLDLEGNGKQKPQFPPAGCWVQLFHQGFNSDVETFNSKFLPTGSWLSASPAPRFQLKSASPPSKISYAKCHKSICRLAFECNPARVPMYKDRTSWN